MYTFAPVRDVFVYVQAETPAGDMSLNVRKTITDNAIHSLTMAAKAGAMAVDGEAAIDLTKRSIDIMMRTADGEQLYFCFYFHLLFTVFNLLL